MLGVKRGLACACCQGKVEMSPSWQSRNVPFRLDLWKVRDISAGAGEAETGSAGEQPDQGLAGRNSSRTMGCQACFFRRAAE